MINAIVNKKNILALLCAALLPLTVTLTWLYQNAELPTSDATDYLDTAVKIYRYMHTHGFWQGVLHMPHGFRPIFFPVLIVPFLFLSHENLFFAFQSVAVISVFASALYVYLLLRLVLDKKTAIIASNFVLLSPIFLNPIFTFFAESALFPAIIAAIYHLHQSQFFTRKWHTILFVLMFALAVLIRPIEALTALMPVVFLFLFFGKQQKYFSSKQILQVAAVGSSALFFAIILVVTHFLDHYPFEPIDGSYYDIKLTKTIYESLIITLLATVTTWLLVYASRYQQARTSELLKPFLYIILICALWFLPNIYNTFVWVFRTSIGDIAATPVLHPVSRISLLQSLLSAAGALSVLGISVLAAINLLLTRTARAQIGSHLSWYLLIILPFPIWEVLNTVQNTPRKLSIALPVFLIWCALVGLSKGKFHRLRITLFAGLTCLQFLFALNYFTGYVEAPTVFRGIYVQPIDVKPNPHDVVLNFLDAAQHQYHLHKIGIEVHIEQALPIDTFLLNMLSQVRLKKYSILYPYFSHYQTENTTTLSTKMDAVFVADLASNMLINPSQHAFYLQKSQNEYNPTLKTLYELLTHYAGNTLADIGFVLGPCINLVARDRKTYQGCLLLSQHQN